MDIDEILASDNPVPGLFDLLDETPSHEWSAEYARLEELLHFNGRIFGGGLGHAIGVASDNVIPDALRLLRKFGTPDVVLWVSRLETYFAGSVLGQDREARQLWELEYIKSPNREFEALDSDVMELEFELGRAFAGFVRENIEAFRQCALRARGDA